MQRHAPNGRAADHIGDYSIERGRAAIVAASDFTALLSHPRRALLGLAVPRDVSVTGYDSAPIMAFTDPPLTTVQQPVEQLAAAAVRSLIEDIEGAPRPRQELLFEPELIVRGFTAASPRRSG